MAGGNKSVPPSHHPPGTEQGTGTWDATRPPGQSGMTHRLSRWRDNGYRIG